jgi:hypothetical protein
LQKSLEKSYVKIIITLRWVKFKGINESLYKLGKCKEVYQEKLTCKLGIGQDRAFQK